jgi:hypothetical protein
MQSLTPYTAGPAENLREEAAEMTDESQESTCINLEKLPLISLISAGPLLSFQFCSQSKLMWDINMPNKQKFCIVITFFYFIGIYFVL